MIAAGVLWTPGGLPQSCQQCRHPEHGPERRKQWGCDEPTEWEQLVADCVVCSGKSETCSHCNGEGKVRYYRCPNTLLKRDAADVCRAALMFEQGVLPVGGGWAEQSAPFIDALSIARSELAHYRRMAMKDK